MLSRLDRWLLIATCTIILAITAINFVTSYSHIYLLGMKFGETGVDARLGPVGIDGMLLVLGFANVFAARMSRPSRVLRLAMAFAVASTVAANGAFGAHWGITGGLVSTWSPIALFIAVEAGLYMFKVAAEWLAEQEAKAQTVDPLEEKRRRKAEYERRHRQRKKATGTEPVSATSVPDGHTVDNGASPRPSSDAFPKSA